MSEENTTKLLVIKKIIWFIYRKIRPALGLALGQVLMYYFFNDVKQNILFLVVGIFFVHLFGDIYNDYWDYDDDINNNRKDKLTLFLPKKFLKRISLLILTLGLLLLYISNMNIFILFSLYAVLLTLYSHPIVRLKRYDIYGYMLTVFPWFLFPFFMDKFLLQETTVTTYLFAIYFFSQWMYILCQKDSTDTMDSTNLFLKRGWSLASSFCILFAAASSFSLLALSLTTLLKLIWFFNLSVKIINLKLIFQQKIGRKTRGLLVLMEFITPYLFVIAYLLT